MQQQAYSRANGGKYSTFSGWALPSKPIGVSFTQSHPCLKCGEANMPPGLVCIYERGSMNITESPTARPTGNCIKCGDINFEESSLLLQSQVELPIWGLFLNWHIVPAACTSQGFFLFGYDQGLSNTISTWNSLSKTDHDRRDEWYRWRWKLIWNELPSAWCEHAGKYHVIIQCSFFSALRFSSPSNALFLISYIIGRLCGRLLVLLFYHWRIWPTENDHARRWCYDTWNYPSCLGNHRWSTHRWPGCYRTCSYQPWNDIETGID